MGAAASSPRRTLPRSFRKIRLELAREKGRPAGSASSGYIIVAPLDQDRRFDPEVWKEYRDACRVVRFRPGEDDDIGHLVHRRGGSWAFHYDIRGDEDDEAGYHFQDERFEIGEYVSVREADTTHTYRVVSVEPI
jgi:hypothetical protein